MTLGEKKTILIRIDFSPPPGPLTFSLFNLIDADLTDQEFGEKFGEGFEKKFGKTDKQLKKFKDLGIVLREGSRKNGLWVIRK